MKNVSCTSKRRLAVERWGIAVAPSRACSGADCRPGHRLRRRAWRAHRLVLLIACSNVAAMLLARAPRAPSRGRDAARDRRLAGPHPGAVAPRGPDARRCSPARVSLPLAAGARQPAVVVPAEPADPARARAADRPACHGVCVRARRVDRGAFRTAAGAAGDAIRRRARAARLRQRPPIGGARGCGRDLSRRRSPWRCCCSSPPGSSSDRCRKPPPSTPASTSSNVDTLPDRHAHRRLSTRRRRGSRASRRSPSGSACDPGRHGRRRFAHGAAHGRPARSRRTARPRLCRRRRHATASTADWDVVIARLLRRRCRFALMRGRGVLRSAIARARRTVAIINETMAARLWPGRDPIGQKLLQQAAPDRSERAARRSSASRATAKTCQHLAKPTAELHLRAAGAAVHAEHHLLRASRQQRRASARSIRSRLAELRQAVVAFDPNLPVIHTQTLEQATAIGLLPQRLAAWIAGERGHYRPAARGARPLRDSPPSPSLSAHARSRCAWRLAPRATSVLSLVLAASRARSRWSAPSSGLALAAGVSSTARRPARRHRRQSILSRSERRRYC